MIITGDSLLFICSDLVADDLDVLDVQAGGAARPEALHGVDAGLNHPAGCVITSSCIIRQISLLRLIILELRPFILCHE